MHILNQKKTNHISMNKILFIVFLLFCYNQNAQAETRKPLPEGAIRIVYPNPNGIYIPAKINNSVKGYFLFDTGATNLGFDSTFFANADLQISNWGTARVGGIGTGGAQIVPLIRDSIDFVFGYHVFRTTNVYISDRKPAHGDCYDGILGNKYFFENKYVVEISYADEYMVLHNNLSTIDLSGYSKISKKKQDVGISAKFYVPITIQVNDTLTIEDYFMFDTGAGGAIHISTTTAEKYNLPALDTEKFRYALSVAGMSGPTTSVLFKVNSVEIGGHKLDDVTLLYSEDQSGTMVSAHAAGGLLGNRILQNFDMVIDFGDDLALYLKPNRNFGTPFEDISLYRGFQYADRSQTLKGWVVRGFFEGTPAERSGMRSGDKIIFVNGVCVLEIPHEKQFDFWKNLDKAELVVLRNGEVLRFEFELNF